MDCAKLGIMFDTKVWFVYKEHQHVGPLSTLDLQRQLGRGEITPHTHVWRAGMPEWKLASEIDFSNTDFSNQNELEPQNSLTQNEIQRIWLPVRKSTTLKKAKVKKYDLWILLGSAALLFSGAVFFRSHFPTHPSAVVSVRSDAKHQWLELESNLPDQTELTIQIDGKPESLIGHFYLSTMIRRKVQNGRLKTPPLQTADGQPLPEGIYKIVVICQNCKQQRLTEDEFSVGNTTSSAYRQRLEFYHARLGKQAQAELTELYEWTQTLLQQLVETQNSFAHKDVQSWAHFHDEWSQMEEQMEVAMKAWTPAFLQEEFYYGTVYAKIKRVAATIRDIHSEQSEQISQFRQTDLFEDKVKEVKLTIENIQKKILQVQKQPVQENGLPPRLDHI
jgi:hypothetical protein